MTSEFEPFGKHAVCTLHHIDGAESVIMHDRPSVVPLYMFDDNNTTSSRIPSEFMGDLYFEIISQGVYEEKLNVYEAGTYWAELNVVRFNMTGTHPVLGEMSIQLDESRSGSRASIRSIKADSKFPIWNRARLFVTATVTAMPGVILQNRGAPLFLHSDALTQWPPGDAFYRFDVQVPLERRDRPGEIVVTFNPGAIRIISNSAQHTR